MNLSKNANKKIVLFFVFFFLNVTAFTTNNHADNEKDIQMILTVVDQVSKIKEPIKLKIYFFSRKSVYRLYKHPIIGVSAAISILRYKLIFPEKKILSEVFDDYNLYLGGVKYPYKGDYIDISPENSYTEYVKIYPGDDYNEVWPCEGEVKIQARYYYKHNKVWKYGSDLWEGEIESNWVTVKVIK